MVKRDKDLSKDAEKVIESVEALLSERKFEESITQLLSFEKETRSVADFQSYIKIVCYLLDVHVRFEAWESLIDLVTQLSKRRGQFKQAIVEIVQRCMSIPEKIKDSVIRVKFMKNLCQISENKIYVENERARLLLALSLDAETTGDIEEALELVRDLQVDSYGLMSSDEKNEIMLEQIRLMLAQNDLIRAQLVSKRIFSNTIDEKTNSSLKQKYYQTLMRLKFLQKQFLEVTQLGLACVGLQIVSSNPDILYPTLKTAMMCLFVCPFDQTRLDLSIRISEHRNIIEMGSFRRVLEMFLVDEIIDWASLDQKYGGDIRVFLNPGACPYITSVEDSEKMYNLLRTRANEHNLRVIHKCYSQISMHRLAQLLNLSLEEAETVLCQAVYSKVIFARINRPKLLIVFKPDLEPSQVLNTYMDRIDNLLMSIGHVATLINKEYTQAGMAVN